MQKYRDRRIYDEPDITGLLVGRLDAELEGSIGGLEWDCSIPIRIRADRSVADVLCVEARALTGCSKSAIEGELIEGHGEVVRAGGSIVFMRGTLPHAGDAARGLDVDDEEVSRGPGAASPLRLLWGMGSEQIDCLRSRLRVGRAANLSARVCSCRRENQLTPVALKHASAPPRPFPNPR